MKHWLTKLLQSSWEQKIFPICLVLGVIILLFSNNHVSNTKPKEKTETVTLHTVSYEESLEQRLENTLCMLEGAGKVQVMLILKDHGNIQIEKDISYRNIQTQEEDAGGGNRIVTEEEKEESVIYDKDSEPFITKEESPQVQGALVLAEGADSSIVRQQILQSVAVLLDLSVSEIQVLPYKYE